MYTPLRAARVVVYGGVSKQTIGMTRRPKSRYPIVFGSCLFVFSTAFLYRKELLGKEFWAERRRSAILSHEKAEVFRATVREALEEHKAAKKDS